MIPIGKPLNNVEIYIVDQEMNLVPIGITGELCIAGVGLARGYYNAPDLTREKFVEFPKITEKKFIKQEIWQGGCLMGILNLLEGKIILRK